MNKMIKLYKLGVVSKLNRDFKQVFDEVGRAYLNPAHVVMLLRTSQIAPMRRSEPFDPSILCITKIIMSDGTIYYTDEAVTAIHDKIFGGN